MADSDPELAALLVAVEDDPRSANQALSRLADLPGAIWLPADWRRVARVARLERSKPLPDIDAMVLLARQGPPEALASVALTAFRPGPEDAEDRLVASAQLGRFDDPRVADWIAALLTRGACNLECLHAILLAQHWSREAGPWIALLERAAGLGARGTPLETSDAAVRWTALDGLSHLAPERAFPLLRATLDMLGFDDPPWFRERCALRALDLSARLPTIEHEPVHLAPLADLRAQVHARCPRVARHAALRWQQGHGRDLWLEQRAAIEKALVDRGQLIASLLSTVSTLAAELDESWTPSCDALSEVGRAALIAEESAWLD